MKKLNPFVVSSCKGRIRLRCGSLKDDARAKEMAEALKTTPGLKSFSINSTTGSLLISFDPEEFNSEKFEQIFLGCADKPVPARPLAVCAEKALKSKSMRKIENRGMLLFSAVTVLSIFTKTWKLHTWAGIGYVALSALHSYRYRKTLLR